MSKVLTPTSIAHFKAGLERFEVSDGGCAGLRVVVFPSGAKSFVVRYRFRGIAKKLTLGPCLIDRHHDLVEPAASPELDTPLSLAAARELCTKALREAESGHDPAAAKAHAKEQERAAESETLTAIAQEYLRREGGKLRSFRQRQSDLDLLCSSFLGRLPIADIKKGQFVRVIDHIEENNSALRADRVMSALKRLLGWYSERTDYVSPLGRSKRRVSIKDNARSRVLSDDELRRVWTAAEQGGLFGAFVRFTLLTATRRGESAGLQRSELWDNGTNWIIPGTRYKNKQDTLIPLSKAAQAIIAAQPDLGDFVFSATGARALTGFDARKDEFDAISGVSDYRIHDLRRTARTLLSHAGIPTDIAERCLGHAMEGVRATYDRHPYEAEMRQAFEALAALIDRIVHGTEPVTELAAERARRSHAAL
jgi:integrase